MSNKYTAVIDRVVDDKHVVLELLKDSPPEEGYTGYVDQVITDKSSIPNGAYHTGAVFEVLINNNEVVDATYLPEEEAQRRQAAQKKTKKAKDISELDPDEPP